MSNIEKIHQEIERLKKILEESTYYLDNSQQALGYSFALDDFKEFIDSLPDENNPEPYNPVYDEDYLNEKIAKATKSWEGVDVNKMLADCRGYEEKLSYVTDSPGDPGNPGEPGISDLEEAAEERARKIYPYEGGTKGLICETSIPIFKAGFIAGAEWQKGQKPELVRHPPITYTYNSNASRDERLQAALLALLGSDLVQVKDGGYFTKQDLIEWVKKKPTEWNVEDIKTILDLSFWNNDPEKILQEYNRLKK